MLCTRTFTPALFNKKCKRIKQMPKCKVYPFFKIYKTQVSVEVRIVYRICQTVKLIYAEAIYLQFTNPARNKG